MTQHTSSLCKLFDQGGKWWSTASHDLASTITRPKPNWDDFGWVGPQSEGKSANKCSPYVGTPSRLLEKHSRWSCLREYQECAYMLSRQRVATLKNLKSISSFVIIKKNPWMSRCVQTFEWYCTYEVKIIKTKPRASGFYKSSERDQITTKTTI